MNQALYGLLLGERDVYCLTDDPVPAVVFPMRASRFGKLFAAIIVNGLPCFFKVYPMSRTVLVFKVLLRMVFSFWCWDV